MRLQPLNHLIDVVRAVAQPARILVLGSASLLPEHPELGSAGAPLELTTDADFLLEPVNEAIAESLQLAAGRDSAFMANNGYYADILRPTIAEALPAGWESRLHPVAGYANVFALPRFFPAPSKFSSIAHSYFTATNTVMHFRDTGSTNFNQRFYRAVVQQDSGRLCSHPTGWTLAAAARQA